MCKKNKMNGQLNEGFYRKEKGKQKKMKFKIINECKNLYVIDLLHYIISRRVQNAKAPLNILQLPAAFTLSLNSYYIYH